MFNVEALTLQPDFRLRRGEGQLRHAQAQHLLSIPGEKSRRPLRWVSNWMQHPHHARAIRERSAAATRVLVFYLLAGHKFRNVGREAHTAA
jgi:hypothetical protein